MAKKIFLSYCRKNLNRVHVLHGSLIDLGFEVWLDKDLEGGQEWWSVILEQIKACDIFIPCISDSSLYSAPCDRESKYALALGKTLLPVLVTPLRQSLPKHISVFHAVDFTEDSQKAISALARSLFNAKPSKALPIRLPKPPEVPFSKSTVIAERLRMNKLNSQEQRELLFEIRYLHDSPDTREMAIQLLARLRRREDLLASIGDTIDLIASGNASTQPKKDEKAVRKEQKPEKGSFDRVTWGSLLVVIGLLLFNGGVIAWGGLLIVVGLLIFIRW